MQMPVTEMAQVGHEGGDLTQDWGLRTLIPCLPLGVRTFTLVTAVLEADG